MIVICVFINKAKKVQRKLFTLLYILRIPALSLWGFTLMPDLGLFLSVSLLLNFISRVHEREKLSFLQGAVFGLFGPRGCF